MFENVERVLAAAGATADDVPRPLAPRCAAPPASSLVQVVALVVPGARLEVDALAMT